MVTAGTSHFKGNLQQLGNGDDAATIYSALRLYNSGVLDANNLSDGEGATASYLFSRSNGCLLHRNSISFK
jgi:hypothetical protein